ncbi:MAG: PrsW family glutamic-type intramembrane protease [Gracilimonas sp.]|nr:PrsW family glutamic-type intramembrane protease [Gracilimonas sp.]
MYAVLEFSIALLPMVAFLVCMWFFDSFELVKKREVLYAILTGFLVAGAAILMHNGLLSFYSLERSTLSRFIAPFTEEILKFVPVIYLIKTKRVGFMIDAAILGFAIGAGFAIIENLYYLNALTDASLLTWFVRGFGTAIMHGGTVAVAAIISKDLFDTKKWLFLIPFIPGFLFAVILHGLFNMFLLPPMTSALLIIIVLPPVFFTVFKKSEAHTRSWLGTGLDSDMELLKILLAGNISETRMGSYIKSIQEKFPPTVVGDIICYLRIYLELSIKAKGILIMKDSGLELPPDPKVEAQFKELEYLEKQIGTTGKLAIQPLLKISNTDLWQLSLMR